MTLKEAIAVCDELRPGNTYSNELKTRWINELSGMVEVQIWLEALGLFQTELLEYERNKDQELFIPLPYDRMYWLYLVAMVDFANNDTERYSMSYQLFNSVLDDYRHWVATVHNPGKVRPVRRMRGERHHA